MRKSKHKTSCFHLFSTTQYPFTQIQMDMMYKKKEFKFEFSRILILKYKAKNILHTTLISSLIYIFIVFAINKC